MKRGIYDNSRWVRLYPELARYEDPAERSGALRNASCTVRWRYYLLLFAFCGFAPHFITVVFRIAFSQWTSNLPIPSITLPVLSFVITGAVLVFGLQRCFHKRIQRSLRDQLIAAGKPICLKCGYDLRGQIESRCPECGTAFDPKLLRPPRYSDAK